MELEPKLCRDCRFYEAPNVCRSPKNIHIDLVTGERTVKATAASQRETFDLRPYTVCEADVPVWNRGSCSQAGFWWEGKE